MGLRRGAGDADKDRGLIGKPAQAVHVALAYICDESGAYACDAGTAGASGTGINHAQRTCFKEVHGEFLREAVRVRVETGNALP